MMRYDDPTEALRRANGKKKSNHNSYNSNSTGSKIKRSESHNERTTSYTDLTKKYGQKNVAMARDQIKAQLGVPKSEAKYDNLLPWGLIGGIARDESLGKKTMSMYDIDRSKKGAALHKVPKDLMAAHHRIEMAKMKMGDKK
jgi:hypothetical protein